MKSIQGIEGERTEQNIAKFFKSKGYWCYIVPKKVGGQPVDIIALKKNSTWLVDGKHLTLEKASFPLGNRVEANQITTMRYAINFAEIENVGFVIQWDRDYDNLRFLHYNKYKELCDNGIKSIKIEELPLLSEVVI